MLLEILTSAVLVVSAANSILQYRDRKQTRKVLKDFKGRLDRADNLLVGLPTDDDGRLLPPGKTPDERFQEQLAAHSKVVDRQINTMSERLQTLLAGPPAPVKQETTARQRPAPRSKPDEDLDEKLKAHFDKF